MKLPELKRKFKNRYAIRIAAGVLTVALLGSGMTAVAVQADTKAAAVQTDVGAAGSAASDDGEEGTAQTDVADDTDLSDLISVEASENGLAEESVSDAFLDKLSSGKKPVIVEMDPPFNGDISKAQRRCGRRQGGFRPAAPRQYSLSRQP